MTALLEDLVVSDLFIVFVLLTFSIVVFSSLFKFTSFFTVSSTLLFAIEVVVVVVETSICSILSCISVSTASDALMAVTPTSSIIVIRRNIKLDLI